MKYISFTLALLLALISSCSLTPEQEEAFSRQKGLYINSINEGSVLATVSMTYPCFVAYAKKQGPDFFRKTFHSDPEETHIGPQFIVDTKQKGKHIHILFQAEVELADKAPEVKKFTGISEDGGVNWFFMNYNDYRNKNICPQFKRLL